MKNVVYKIENVKSGACYIGSTTDLKQRKCQHLHSLRKDKHYSKVLQEDFKKQGEQDFVFCILELDIPYERLVIREQHFMDIFQPVYNGSKMAIPRLGATNSEESKQKFREKMIGRKIHTNESKAAIGKAQLGNKHGAGNTTKRKVTPEILEQVAKLRAEGKGCRKIAAALSLNKTTILNIFNNKFAYG